MARSAGVRAAGAPVPTRKPALDTPYIVGADSDMSPRFSRRAVNWTGHYHLSVMPWRRGGGDVADSPAVAGAFRHVGYFYQTEADYATTVAGFLRDVLAAGEPAFAAV